MDFFCYLVYTQRSKGIKYSYVQSSCKQTSVGAGFWECHCVANDSNEKTVFAEKKLIIRNKFLMTRVRTKGINLPQTPCTVHLGLQNLCTQLFLLNLKHFLMPFEQQCLCIATQAGSLLSQQRWPQAAPAIWCWEGPMAPDQVTSQMCRNSLFQKVSVKILGWLHCRVQYLAVFFCKVNSSHNIHSV